MLVAGGVAKDVKEGERLCRDAIRLGIARELFLANIRSQGGQIDRLLELRDRWRAKDFYEVLAPATGYIAGIDAYKIGVAGVYLGVGRDKTTDPVFPDVGFVFKKKAGHAVVGGEHICTAYGKDSSSLEAALPLIVSAFAYASSPPEPRTLVIKEISAL
jgi:pyrimidine-nucleoside phosphorylase